jgi:hypothetical protein
MALSSLYNPTQTPTTLCVVPSQFDYALFRTLLSSSLASCSAVSFYVSSAPRELSPLSRALSSSSQTVQIVELPLAPCPNPNRDSCRGQWEKTFHMLSHAVSTNHDYDYTVKVDTDALFFADNLALHAQRNSNIRADKPLYTGKVLRHGGLIPGSVGNTGYYGREARFLGLDIVAGGVVVLNAATINVLRLHLHSSCGVTPDKRAEDVELAMCLRSMGVLPTELIDASEHTAKETFIIFPLEQILQDWGGDHDWWYFINNSVAASGGNGADCCSYNPIALHGYKDAKELLQIWKHIEGEQMIGGVVGDYLDRVGDLA